MSGVQDDPLFVVLILLIQVFYSIMICDIFN